LRNFSSRRSFLAALSATLVPVRTRAASEPSGDALKVAGAQIAAIEAQAGGRLGITVVDSGSNALLTHRAEERFPMCSTFKLLAVAAVLKQVDAGKERLDRKISYGSDDLAEYAPITKDHVKDGGMRLSDLCAAAIDWSDNTAGNLLLQVIGGPDGLTKYARSIDDLVTRLDRNEPALNSAIPGDERDTTAPLAMVLDMQKILLGHELSDFSCQQLETWLQEDRVGVARLRAGLPPTWRVGDKTGSGANGTANTIAIVRPPNRPPILAAVYHTGSSASVDSRNAVHKEIGRIIANTF
jgi:beta-lactamase class A